MCTLSRIGATRRGWYWRIRLAVFGVLASMLGSCSSEELAPQAHQDTDLTLEWTEYEASSGNANWHVRVTLGPGATFRYEWTSAREDETDWRSFGGTTRRYDTGSGGWGWILVPSEGFRLEHGSNAVTPQIRRGYSDDSLASPASAASSTLVVWSVPAIDYRRGTFTDGIVILGSDAERGRSASRGS